MLTQAGGFTVTDASRVTLLGSYNATPAIILSGGGLFTNQGSVNTGQDAILTSTTASTTVINAAKSQIVGRASGVIQVQGGGVGALTVSNAGLIKGEAFDGVTQHGTGALNVTNASTGVIYGQATDPLNGYGVGSDGEGKLTLTNDAGGTIVGRYGVVGSNAADQITNAGTIASGSYTAGTGGNPDTITPGGTAGVRLSAGGTVTNLAGGSIRSAGQGIDASGALSLTNAGTISSTTQSGVFLRAGGTISNTGTGAISGQNGMDSSASAAAITVTGNGTFTGAAGFGIRAQSSGGDIVLGTSTDKLGAISGTTSGIIASTSGAGTISIVTGGNVTGGTLATISAQATGSGTVTVTTSGGIIQAGQDQNGIIARSADGLISVTNGDTIRHAMGVTGGTGIDARNSGTGGVSLTNSGTISAAGGSFVNGIIAVSSNAQGTVSITNQSGGVIGGAAALTGTGITADGAGNVTVSNAASINAATGIGASSRGAGAVTVNHTAGTIQATDTGIDARSTGSGAIVVNQSGGSIGTSGAPIGSRGINAERSTAGAITVTSGAIFSGNEGVRAFNFSSGAGDIVVTANGSITATRPAINTGITAGTGNVVITTAADTTLSTSSVDTPPISGFHGGAGAGYVQITNGAIVTRPSGTGGIAITAANGTSNGPSAGADLAGTLTAIAVSNTGTITNNFTTGISATARSAGTVTVGNSGTVAAQTTGISAGNSGSGAVSVSVTGGSVVATAANSTGIAISGGNAGNAVTVTGATTKIVGTLYGVDAASAVAIINSGTIASGSFAGNDPAGAFATGGTAGIRLQAGGTVTNQAGGVIDSGGRGVSLGSAGTVDNQLGGIIRHTGTASNSDGDGTGVYAAANLTLTNAGSIRTAAVGNNDGVTVYGVATITNSGLIKAEGASGIAIAGASSSITNSGTIQGGTRGDGVNLNNGGAVLNRVGGTIQSSGNRGITSGGALTLTNLDTINGNTDGVGLSGGASSILNAGRISSTTNFGVAAGGTGATLSVTNARGGTINGGSDTTNGYGLGSDGQAMTVNNYGSIGGQAGGIIALNNLTLTANLYAGSVTGSIRGSGGADTVSVYTGTGTSNTTAVTAPDPVLGGTVTVRAVGTFAAAAVNGTIDLGSGANTLNLRGTGDGSTANGAVGTITGVIAGTTAVNKQDAGTFVLSGANTYTGATTVSAGILNIQSNTALGTNAAGTTVVSGATLQLQNGVTITGEALSISGDGSTGSNGALQNVGGANTYNGAITLAAASRINSDVGILTLSAANAVTGTNVGLTLGGTGLGIVAGTITTGTGSLIKDGAGTWALTGANTYTGGTTISAGTLQIGAGGTAGSITGAIVDNGALVFNRSDAVTFGGVISGSGTLQKLGAGVSSVLTLTAAETYTGTTTVSAGTLLVNGSLAAGSAVTVAAGAILGGSATTAGTGTIAGTVAVAGTISAGTISTVGILNTGALTLGANAIFHTDVTNALTADRVNVTGAVNLAGLLDFTTPTDFSGSVGQNLILIANDATDAVTGRFTSLRLNGTSIALESNDTFSTPGHSYLIDYRGGDGNDVAIRDITPGPIQPTPTPTPTPTQPSGPTPQPNNAPSFGETVTDTSSPVGASAGPVYALYKAVLGRTPDPLGLESFTTAIQNGASLTDVANALLGSPEGASAPNAAADPNGFVQSLYQKLLGRAADASGLQTFTGELAAGVSAATVVVQLATSDEAQSKLAPIFQAGVFVPDASESGVARLYYGLLGRAPDANGLKTLTNFVENGEGGAAGEAGRLNQTAAAILTSTEYAGRNPSGNDATFVNNLYQGALGRAPEAGGVDFYLNQIAQGVSRATVALEISQSPEAQIHLVGVIEGGFQLAG